MRMIILTLISSILFSIASCDQEKGNKDFLVQINRIAKLKNDTIQNPYWERAYSINLSLVNNSNSTKRFYLWTCDWAYNFITNSKEFNVIVPECPKNILWLYTLEKNQKIDLTGILAFRDSTDQKSDLKIGFIYIKKNEDGRLKEITYPPPNSDSTYIKSHQSPKRVIWSDSFNIK